MLSTSNSITKTDERGLVDLVAPLIRLFYIFLLYYVSLPTGHKLRNTFWAALMNSL